MAGLLAIALVLLLPLVVNAIANAWTFRPLPASAEPAAGLVSVLVTARDEAERLGPLLESYAALGDAIASELVVYDDDSRDGTAALVLAHAERDRRIRLVRGGELPEGWGGKVHGLHRLSEEARGDWLLFVDADVTLATGALDRSVAALRDGGDDVLSLYPQQTMKTLAERLFVPVMVYYFFLVGPQWLHRLGAKVPVAPLNGQFMLFRRDAYRALGGYEAIRDAWLDDMAMGRRVAERGFSAVYRPGTGLARCRMYTSLGETWRGFVKHTWDCLGLPAGAYFLLHGWFFVALVLPWLLLAAGPVGPLEWGLAAAVAALTALTRGLACWRGGGGWLSAIAHPVTMAAALVVGLASFWQYRRGGHTWKGRPRRIPQ